jgi:hypothetical protein
MLLSLLAFLAFVGICASWFVLAWHLVAIYGEKAELSRAVGRAWQIRGLSRYEGESLFGFMDLLGVTHTRSYTATLELEKPLEIRLVRYFPDAFGRPWGDRLNGRRINWQKRPLFLGFLWANRCRVLRRAGIFEGFSISDPLP